MGTEQEHQIWEYGLTRESERSGRDEYQMLASGFSSIFIEKGRPWSGAGQANSFPQALFRSNTRLYRAGNGNGALNDRAHALARRAAATHTLHLGPCAPRGLREPLAPLGSRHVRPKASAGGARAGAPVQLLVATGSGASRRWSGKGYVNGSPGIALPLHCSPLTKPLCSIIISTGLSFVYFFVTWLCWPWHTDRPLHYTPIHVHCSLATRGCNTHAAAEFANPQSGGVDTGYADCGIVFQVVLLSAIHSTSSDWGTRVARAQKKTGSTGVALRLWYHT